MSMMGKSDRPTVSVDDEVDATAVVSVADEDSSDWVRVSVQEEGSARSTNLLRKSVEDCVRASSSANEPSSRCFILLSTMDLYVLCADALLRHFEKSLAHDPSWSGVCSRWEAVATASARFAVEGAQFVLDAGGESEKRASNLWDVLPLLQNQSGGPLEESVRRKIMLLGSLKFCQPIIDGVALGLCLASTPELADPEVRLQAADNDGAVNLTVMFRGRFGAEDTDVVVSLQQKIASDKAAGSSDPTTRDNAVAALRSALLGSSLLAQSLKYQWFPTLPPQESEGMTVIVIDKVLR